MKVTTITKKATWLFLFFAMRLTAWAGDFTDVTSLLINNAKFPTVSSGWWDSSTGWFTDLKGGNLRVLSNASGNDVEAGECTSLPNSLERWTPSAFASSKRILYQEISAPNGLYRLRLAAQAANLNDASKANADSVYIFANDAIIQVTNAKALKYYEVDGRVTNGKLTIGIATGKNNVCNYANIADVTLLVAKGSVDCTAKIDSLNAMMLANGENEEIENLVSVMADSTSDYAKINAYIKADAATKEYKILHSSADQPANVSTWVVNASCTENYGWLRNSADASANYNTVNKEFSNSLYSGMCIESWYHNPVKGSNLIWQKLTNIMPGSYKLKALCVGQVYNDNTYKGKCLQGTYIFAGNKRTAIDSPTWKEYELEFDVKPGEQPEIGITADSTNLNDWTGIAQVRLYMTGIGEAQQIFLSDDYDCNAVQADTYADVFLHMQMRQKDYSTLCLPFNMPMTTARKLFSSIQVASGANAVGNDIELTNDTAMFMEYGQCYIVCAAQNIDGVVSIPNVMVHAAKPTTQAVGVAKFTGSYRCDINGGDNYLLRKDNPIRLHKPEVNATLKAYSARVTKQ